MIKQLAIIAALFSALAAGAQAPLLQPHKTFVDGSGAPCSGCSLYSYVAGTTTPQATYTDSSLGTPNTNPVILDVAGGAQIWLGASAYKFALKDTIGQTIWTVDNVNPTVTLAGLQTYLPIIIVPPTANLQTAINAAGSNSDLTLVCGTYTVSAGLSIANSNVHLHGASRDCTFINFTSVTGLSASGANVEIDGITFEGQTGPYSVQFTGTATGFRFHDNAITQAGQGASTFPQAPLWIQSGNSDSLVENNIFYGNGPLAGQPAGYTILTDGQTAGYVNRLHLIHNKIYSNNNGISMALFDCNACVIQNPDIDQNNADFVAAEGTGYGLMLYSMGYNTGTTSLARVSNTVTMVVPTMPATWPPTANETMMVTGYGFGGNGTSFNGVVTLLTVSGTGTGPYTMTWAQTAPDDTVTGAALSPGTIQPPVQHVVIGNPHITNTAGACLYLQGVSDISIAGGELSQCDLSITPVSLPHSGVGIAGLVGGSITGMHVDTVGHSSAFSLNHTYGLAFGTNAGKNANKNCVTLFDNYNLSATGNTCRNNTGGGFVGQSTTGINSYKSSFTGNDIWMTGSGSGYAFQGTDQYDKVTGGSVHAPATGTAVAGVFALASTSNISATGVEVDCYADGGTVSAMSYGLRTAGTDAHFEGNSAKGCGVAGIFDAGTNTTAQANKISSSVIGILSTGTTPNILFNTLTGNTTALTNSGATNPVVLGNVTVAGTLPILRTSNLIFADGTNFTTASLAAQSWAYGANANTVELLTLNAATGTQRFFGALTAGVARWSWGADSDTESGADSGSPWALYAFHDNGTSIGRLFWVPRDSSASAVLVNPLTLSAISGLTQCLHVDSVGLITGTGSDCGSGGGGGGVTSINGTAGAFTFTGSGVSCTTTTCTFSGAGGGAITPTSVTVSTFIYTNAEFSNGTCTTAKTIDPANGNRQKVTLTDAATCALTFTQPAAGTATVQIKVTQSAAGAFSGGVSGCKWPGGVVPTITQTSGAVDMLTAYFDGTTAYCQIAQAFN